MTTRTRLAATAKDIPGNRRPCTELDAAPLRAQPKLMPGGGRRRTTCGSLCTRSGPLPQAPAASVHLGEPDDRAASPGGYRQRKIAKEGIEAVR